MKASTKGQAFTMMDDEFMKAHPHLSIDSRWLYLRLRRYGRRLPTLKHIAESHGVDYHTLYRAVKQLVEHAMIVKVAHGRYEVCDDANLICSDATSSCESATPTTETTRNTKTKPARAAQEDEMILNSYGDSPDSDAEDLPKPRTRRTVAVEKWHGGTLAAYMDEQVITNYFGKATVQRAKIAGFLKHRMKKGISPVEVKEVIDAFIGNPANAEQPLDMSSLFLREFDGLLARVRTLAPGADSPSGDLLAAYADLLDE